MSIAKSSVAKATSHLFVYLQEAGARFQDVFLKELVKKVIDICGRTPPARPPWADDEAKQCAEAIYKVLDAGSAKNSHPTLTDQVPKLMVSSIGYNTIQLPYKY